MQKEMRCATAAGWGRGAQDAEKKGEKKDTRGLFNLAWGLYGLWRVWWGSTRTHHIALCVLNTLDVGCRKCDVNAVLSLPLLQSPLPTYHHHLTCCQPPPPHDHRRQKESLTLRSSKVPVPSSPLACLLVCPTAAGAAVAAAEPTPVTFSFSILYLGKTIYRMKFKLTSILFLIQHFLRYLYLQLLIHTGTRVSYYYSCYYMYCAFLFLIKNIDNYVASTSVIYIYIYRLPHVVRMLNII